MRIKYIHFIKYRYYSYVISIILILLSAFSLYSRGLNLGLDFTGGTMIEVRFQTPVSVKQVDDALYKVNIKDAVVQRTNTGDIIVKIRVGEKPSLVEKALNSIGSYKLLQREDIGSVVSGELRKKAVWAIITALVGILIYLSFRYEFLFALGGILALAHDVFIVVGAYSWTYKEVSLDVLASILVVAGYSITDTVVVFDRIRENLKLRKGMDLSEIINLSVNQNIVRTIMTSSTVFLSSLGLYLFGGSVLSDISFAFLIGVVVGTLSSIFVASALVLDIKILLRKIKKQKPKSI
ncbi:MULTISPECIES: protein translocase subunit SecF [unclassified Hydrogenobaculum]|uniref:protein translocase subunit SecF n=1 Tax=unclassified Hydrogenobaculum TaxID=2622382 RepID=UPI0001C506B7|nr:MULTISPECIES: protein translocase subunit SecF [unclassified Hydrogenobaculum]AEF18536.1 protein-export membrane protein SecF [Hydrogenobaculum sp. 3684]AEG45824.1 protein-export membrane protein SecF [Hydrogenobaculum sp. SHO]AGG14466.1 protein-export membrane protein SecF [Hydrogenobaculum sp. HO]AGH92770.1 protein-export membrane protein, SecD/SecF family [Hydrogenobaculum sp. SN]